MGVILNLAGSGSVSFAIGYFTFVTAIFAITTISYDEFDNGLAFLMTLPVTRKQYVAEKYLLGAGLTAAAWGIEAITGVICKGVAELQGCLSEKIIGTLIYIPLALLMLSVSLPLVIHFGAEKGRYIAMVMWAIIIAVVYALIKTMGLSAALFEEAHPAKDITILSNDNLNLYGAYYKNEAAASDHLWAIVIHGYRCDHNSMTEFSQRYYENGYQVVAPDLRACGKVRAIM